MKTSVVLLLLAALVLCSACTSTSPPQASTQTVGDLHRSMNAEDLPRLVAIIEGSGDDYTREQAVFVYADIARQNGKGKEAMDFFKKVAYEEQNDEVRTAAYANYYLLRQDEPPLLTLNVTVEGEIRSGRTITITAIIRSEKGYPEASVYLQAENPETELNTIAVLGPDRISTPITEGTPLNVPFTVSLLREGDAILRLRAKSVLDRLEYEEVDRTVYLSISNQGGSYQVM